MCIRDSAYAIYTCLNPGGDIFLSRLYAAGNHELRPGHRCLETLDEFRAEYIAGEHLAEVAADFLCGTDFRD